eukprot:TRINITY_DN4996_c0_g1_i2.p1 TRINITY_DN4996_c0_g1~~TRINITY_DN4996_c0_g1_i2.p1  ORF type:complete len:1162 (+),score=273.79 TRINITY_DN4996_c0_g1_i2:93-3488(+)
MRITLALCAAAAAAQPQPATRLRCDGSDLHPARKQPHTDFTLPSLRPVFEWVPRHSARGRTHRAYQIRVSQAASGAPVWDSGVLTSAEPRAVYPRGAAVLSGGVLYDWVVRWQDDTGAWSTWSDVGRFRTPLSDAQWSGVSWLGGGDSNLFRADFNAPAGLASVTLYVCGLGYSRALVNGADAGDAVLTTSAWTNNERQNAYSAFDVTALLKAGAPNTVGVALGNGWHDTKMFPRKDGGGEKEEDLTPRVLRAQLVAAFPNGSSAVLTRTGDAAWQSAAGPVVGDSVYNGESYDARREQSGWAAPGFSPATPWGAAPRASSPPRGPMVPWAAPAITVSRVLQPASTWAINPEKCGTASESATLELGCAPGEAISAIGFASFGTPTGDCTAGFSKGKCDAPNSSSIVAAACVGRSSCTVTATDQLFSDPCYGTAKHLSAAVDCAPSPKAPPPARKWVVDFGSNLAGVVRLKGVRGPAGSNVTLRHAEILQHAGLPGLENPDPRRIYQDNLRVAKATDVYTMRGDAAGETWTPWFTYHGFRYVEVSGLLNFSAANIEMLHLHSAVAQRANATFSSPTLQRMLRMALGAQRSNMMAVPTDCDNRDERLGWMGDAALSVDAIGLGYDAAPFLRDFVRNIVTELGPDGSVPDIVPWIRGGGRPGDMAWSNAFVQIHYVLWKTYGDAEIVKQNLGGMASYLENLAAQAQGGVSKIHMAYGDWCPPPQKMGGGQGIKPGGCYTEAAAYIAAAQMVSEMANATGNATLAQRASSLAATGAQQFNAAWYHPDKGAYDNAGQTAQALPIMLGIAPAEASAALMAAASAANHHWSTGIIGFKSLFDALRSSGNAAEALALLEQTDYPSVGYMFANPDEKASENLWEIPDANREGTGMNSRNHHMFSSFSHYLLAHVAGLDQAPGSTAHSRLLLRPMNGGALDLSAAAVELDTARGLVRHSWRRSGGAQCGKAAEGDTVHLSCGPSGGVISEVRFASFGTPYGSACRVNYTRDDRCHAANSLDEVRRRCLGRSECRIDASRAVFPVSGDGCQGDGVSLRLWVDAECSGPLSLRVNVSVPVSATAELVLPTTALGLTTPLLRDAHASAITRTLQLQPSVDAGHVVHSAELPSGEYQLTLSAASA